MVVTSTCFFFNLLQVEVQISKLYCVNRAMPTLPINIEDAARSEVEIEQAAVPQFVSAFCSRNLKEKVIGIF